MRHNNTTILAISRTPNPTKFQKTLGLNDFYFGSDDWDFPLGHIQMVGKSDGVQIHGEGLPDFLQWFPNKPFEWLAQHSIDFWLTSEDLPLPQNRIFYDGDRVNLDLTPTNMEGAQRLKQKLRESVRQARRSSASVRALALSRQGRPDRRYGPSGGHAAVRDRSGAIRSRSQLQGAWDRQSLRDGCQLFSFDRRGESDPDDHSQCAARRRSHRGTDFCLTKVLVQRSRIRRLDIPVNNAGIQFTFPSRPLTLAAMRTFR